MPATPWDQVCEGCGVTFYARTKQKYHSRACKAMLQLDNLSGRRFGRLTVERLVKSQNGSTLWKCRCDCGNHTEVFTGNLKAKKSPTRSCGCLAKELTAKRATKHGMTETATFRSWSSMKTRCLNPRAKCYGRYGGRGITICKRWLHSFENFLADMGLRPSPGHSLDRIDNDGDYEPGNCRWATAMEQRHNASNVCVLTHDGKTMLVIEWARYLGIRPITIYSRLRKGWSVARTLNEPVRKDRRYQALHM